MSVKRGKIVAAVMVCEALFLVVEVKVLHLDRFLPGRGNDPACGDQRACAERPAR